jgi:hypothetical protein
MDERPPAVGRCVILGDPQGGPLAVAHVHGRLSAAASVALTELARAAREQMAAQDPHGFQGDRQRRAIARLRREPLADCGHEGGRDLLCTRPVGHLPADVHAVANGAVTWKGR